jgi:hypothetical protein
MSELVFAEFVESVARVATLKWETKSMQFIDKVQLALESICGIAESISLEQKQILVPDTDWAMIENSQQKTPGKKTSRKSGWGEEDEESGVNLETRSKVKQCAIAARKNRAFRASGVEGKYVPEVRGGQLWASGSEPQLRYKHYVSSSKSGNWTKEGTTFLSIDGWKKGAWVDGARTQRSGEEWAQGRRRSVKVQKMRPGMLPESTFASSLPNRDVRRGFDKAKSNANTS